ncbi:MAG: hypothetical protein ACRD2U_15410 [Terriglobales bacterium]
MLHFLNVGDNFIYGKVFGSLSDELMLVSEVFGRKDFLRFAIVNKKAAAGDSVIGNKEPL